MAPAAASSGDLNTLGGHNLHHLAHVAELIGIGLRALNTDSTPPGLANIT